MKQHLVAGAVALAVASGASYVMRPKTAPQPVAVTVSTSRFAWPDLGDAEVAALAARVKWLGKTRVQIFCDGADCRDLQTSLDNAFEDAGVVSERAIPFNPLGYGIAITYGVGNQDRAVRLADDIEKASNGRLSLHVSLGVYVKDDELLIAIGKQPRKDVSK